MDNTLKIYRLPSGQLEVIKGGALYSLSITPPQLRKLCHVGESYRPAGRLINRPAKSILFTAIKLIEKNQ